MTNIYAIRTDQFHRSARYGPYSQALVVPPGHSLIFTTGMCAFDDKGEIYAPGDAAAQARRIFEQMDALLKEANGSVRNIVKMTVFLADVSDIAAVTEVRNAIWTENHPVSSTVQVRFALPEMRIEIEAVAAIAAAPQ
jgi:2-iminobutanoate/2-iminopropanoate deaminase